MACGAGGAANGSGVPFLCDKSVLELDGGDDCTTLYNVPKTTGLYTLKSEFMIY